MNIITRVQVNFGRLGDYHAVVTRLRPVMERHGWQLVGAYTSLFGRLNEVMNVWEAADAGAASAGLAAMAADPHFVAITGELEGLIAEEDVLLYTKAPYHP